MKNFGLDPSGSHCCEALNYEPGWLTWYLWKRFWQKKEIKWSLYFTKYLQENFQSVEILNFSNERDRKRKTKNICLQKHMCFDPQISRKSNSDLIRKKNLHFYCPKITLSEIFVNFLPKTAPFTDRCKDPLKRIK